MDTGSVGEVLIQSSHNNVNITAYIPSHVRLWKNETSSDKNGLETLWTTYSYELNDNKCGKNYSGSDVFSIVQSLGLEYEEYTIPFNIDITKCFDPDSQNGERLLSALTEKDHFYQEFTPEVRESMLDFLMNKCSTEKDGKILFNNHLSCILVHAWDRDAIKEWNFNCKLYSQNCCIKLLLLFTLKKKKKKKLPISIRLKLFLKNVLAQSNVICIHYLVFIKLVILEACDIATDSTCNVSHSLRVLQSLFAHLKKKCNSHFVLTSFCCPTCQPKACRHKSFILYMRVVVLRSHWLPGVVLLLHHRRATFHICSGLWLEVTPLKECPA